MRRTTRFLLCLGFALLLSSCIKYEQTVVVDESGAVTVTQIVAADMEEALPQLEEMTGEELPRRADDQICDEIEKSSGDTFGAIPVFGEGDDRLFAPYRDGDVCGAEITIELAPAADHSQTMSTIFSSGFSGGTKLLKVEDNWEFETPFDMNTITAGSGLKGQELVDLQNSMEIVFHVEMPGQAVSGGHNATDVNGSRFTWKIDPQNPPTRLVAMTEPKSGLNALPISPKILLVIVINVALFGGVAWYFLRPEEVPPVAVDLNPSAVASPTAAVELAPKGTPVFDETYQIWTIDDPVQGKMWHRAGTDEWVPF